MKRELYLLKEITSAYLAIRILNDSHITVSSASLVTDVCRFIDGYDVYVTEFSELCRFANSFMSSYTLPEDDSWLIEKISLIHMIIVAYIKLAFTYQEFCRYCSPEYVKQNVASFVGVSTNSPIYDNIDRFIDSTFRSLVLD